MKDRYKFLPRMVKCRHLEFDSAFQQLLWALTNPKRVFRYHKDQNAMRGRWSRDDPAFLILICAFLSVSTLGYCLWLRLHIARYLLAWLWVILGDCLTSGVLVATGLWLVVNRFMRKQSLSKPVEWAYCFDVHLNAFVILAFAVYGVQMLLWPLLALDSIVSLLFVNSLWVLALTCYIYVTFLGYTVLPSVHNTMALLYAVFPVLLLFVVSIPLRWNLATVFSHWFKWRTGATSNVTTFKIDPPEYGA